MKHKEKYSPIKISIIILIGFVLFLVFGILYRQDNYTEKWLICEFPSAYETYEETLKFRYMSGELYGYYREEMFYRDNDEDIQEQYDYFIDIAEALDTSEHLAYDVSKVDGGVSVKTYIGVNTIPSFFTNYMTEKQILATDTIEEIKEKLESSNYVCKITNK